MTEEQNQLQVKFKEQHLIVQSIMGIENAEEFIAGT
jgi:hypothetical protein